MEPGARSQEPGTGRAPELQQVERDLDHRGRDHRLVARESRPETPALYSGDGPFVEAQADTLGDANVDRPAAGIHVDHQDHGALESRLAGVLRILGLFLVDELRPSRKALLRGARTARPSDTRAIVIPFSDASLAVEITDAEAAQADAGRTAAQLREWVADLGRVNLNVRSVEQSLQDHQLGLFWNHGGRWNPDFVDRLGRWIARRGAEQGAPSSARVAFEFRVGGGNRP